MFLTGLSQTRARRDAYEAWRVAARRVSVRWQAFLDAGSETRPLAFASYLAALDAEQAAAADVAARAACDRDVVHVRLVGEPTVEFNQPYERSTGAR